MAERLIIENASVLGQMQRKFFTVDGHFVVGFGEGGAAPFFALRFLQEIGIQELGMNVT